MCLGFELKEGGFDEIFEDCLLLEMFFEEGSE